MYSGSLQSRIAEKNLKENIPTKIEQNQQNKKKQQNQNYGAGSKVFWFLGFYNVFLVFWSHTNFLHGKNGSSTKTQKKLKSWFFQPKTKKKHGKSWFFNQKNKKKLIFQPKTKKKHGKNWFFNQNPKNLKKIVFQPKTKK